MEYYIATHRNQQLMTYNIGESQKHYVRFKKDIYYRIPFI